MTIRVNGEELNVESPLSVAALLEKRGTPEGTATAVNGTFVPRSARATHLLKDGDEVEIVAPMQGG